MANNSTAPASQDTCANSSATLACAGSKKPLTLGLAGFGTVGTGLARVLMQNAAGIEARAGRQIRIKTIFVRNPSKYKECDALNGATLTTRMDDLVTDPEIDVIVEVMGGMETPAALIEAAFAAGKHVVTANKALLAESGNRFFQLAAEKNLHLGYEASICGGIPIVQTLREGLAANQIESLMGILNGTSNYILSEMSTKGLDFHVALAQAQKLGFAEADPTFDIEGIDAAHKLALLIRLAWGVVYPFDKLTVKGISSVTPMDIAYAREFGYRIKLLGQARMVNGSIEAGVFPTLVHETLLLARVGGSYNAVRVEGNVAGPIFLHGKGAGDLPTGSAVAADILAIARGAHPNNSGFVSLPGEACILPESESRSAYYIRLLVTDIPGVLRDVAAIMTSNDISIAQVLQKEQKQPQGDISTVPFIMMTHETSTVGIQKALQTLAASNLVHEPPMCYRVLERKRKKIN